MVHLGHAVTGAKTIQGIFLGLFFIGLERQICICFLVFNKLEVLYSSALFFLNFWPLSDVSNLTPKD